MTEGLFILTTIFVAYVVYVIVNEQKTSAATDASGARAEPTTPPIVKAAVKAEPLAAAPVAAAPAPVAAKVTPLPSKAKPTPAAAKAPSKAAAKPKAAVKPITPAPAPAAVAAVGKATGLKDPVSGDVATSYSNYRFTKRWIKDALVAEGLLPKVYKNAELDAGVEAQIKAALLKLEAIDKYKA